MESLDFLLDLLRVDLCLAILRFLVLVPRRREETALLKKSLKAGAQAVVGP